MHQSKSFYIDKKENILHETFQILYTVSIWAKNIYKLMEKEIYLLQLYMLTNMLKTQEKIRLTCHLDHNDLIYSFAD